MQQAIATARHQPTTEMMGGWRLVQKVAESRWFVVYLAAPATCDPDWPPDYVVKCVRPRMAQDLRPRQLLAREKQVGSEIGHPHLATILDADLEHDPPYVVQPFYEGATVSRLIEQRVSGIASALWIARQVAQAMTAMHAAGWLHGDIKPDNVMVSALGHATLIDLGFARRLTARGARPTNVSLQTTLAYAAPELFRPHQEVTGSSDVYSLGVMLYELLSGRHPFNLTDPEEIAWQHLNAPVCEIRRLNPLIPPAIAQLVSKMLSKAPDERPASCELVAKLVACEIECFGLR